MPSEIYLPVKTPKELAVVLHIVWMIVLGLVVGLIARLIVPGKQPMGWPSSTRSWVHWWAR
jgi:hypothetical protein